MVIKIVMDSGKEYTTDSETYRGLSDFINVVLKRARERDI